MEGGGGRGSEGSPSIQMPQKYGGEVDDSLCRDSASARRSRACVFSTVLSARKSGLGSLDKEEKTHTHTGPECISALHIILSGSDVNATGTLVFQVRVHTTATTTTATITTSSNNNSGIFSFFL